MVSFAVAAIMLWILFGLLRAEARGTFILYLVGSIFFCWWCSVACGLYAVKRKKIIFPKMARASSILFCLSSLSLAATTWHLLAAGLLPAGYGRMEAAVELVSAINWVLAVMHISGPVWCLLSFLITIFILIRDVRDIRTWIILITQAGWVVAVFVFASVMPPFIDN